MPFCASAGGGSQRSVIIVELIAFPRGVWGGLDGTGKIQMVVMVRIYDNH